MFRHERNIAKRHITYGELDTGVAGHVNVANIGASTIGVDLVEGDCDFAPSLDLRHGLRGQGILSVFPNVNVSLELCASTRVDDIGFDLGISNDGRVLLARVDADAISSNRGVDFKRGGGGLLLAAKLYPWTMLTGCLDEPTLETNTSGRPIKALRIGNDCMAVSQDQQRRSSQKRRENTHLAKLSR